MMIAYNLPQAMATARSRASVTGRRMRISRRPIIRNGMPWWVIEPAQPTLNGRPVELLGVQHG